MVLDEDFDVAQSRLLKVLSEDRQTALPRPDLCRRSSTAGVKSICSAILSANC